jgi:hypothetical protein
MTTDTAPATVQRVVSGVFATYYEPSFDLLGNPTVLIKTAHRGEIIDVTENEAKRLDSLGTVVDLDLADLDAQAREYALARYRAERGDADAVEAVARAVAPTDPIVDVSVPQPHVSPPPLGATPRGDVVTGDTGGPDTPAPGNAAASLGGLPPADVPDAATVDVAELAAYIEAESPNVSATVDLAQGDPVLAAKVLEAERSATGGDPRKGVEDALSKLTDASGE